MPHIFISYKREPDKMPPTFVRELKSRLMVADLAVWMDDEIPAGTAWYQVIDNALEESIALVVVITPEALTSQYVFYEWSSALRQGIPVIPLIHKPTRLPSRLDLLQHIDFSGETHPWETLIERLMDISAGMSVDRLEPPMSIITALNRPNTLSDAIFQVLASLYHYAASSKITPEVFINRLASSGVLMPEHHAELLRLVREHQRKLRKR